MERRRLGSTGYEVAPISLGTWAFGGDEWGPSDDENAVAVIRGALEDGINMLDTADVYGYGHSEDIVRRALDGWTDEVLVCSKAGNDIYDTPKVAGGGPKSFSAEYLARAVEGSLARLGRDCVDIYLLHNPSLEVIVAGEALGALKQAKQAGKIGLVGASVYTAEEARAAVAQGADVVMLPYSLLAPSEVANLLPDLGKTGTGLFVRSPLFNGLLSGKYSTESSFGADDHRSHRGDEWLRRGVERTEQFRFLERDGRSLAQAALSFVLSTPQVASVVVGARSSSQLAENLKTEALAGLSEEDLSEIGRIIASWAS
ncbi:MAG: Aldo-keto reductase [Acidimicrobiaceae bacterium]|nr:Aldo-keto reductase [Acidimicrobiaceae bacterium]